MNILYCGDRNIRDGVLISILSLIEKVHEPLHVYLLTLDLENQGKHYKKLTEQDTAVFEEVLKKADEKNTVKTYDLTEEFIRELPKANMQTRFTPGCMLRLYADKVKDIPDRLLYLDNDVICRQDCSDYYHQNLDGCELVGTLDYYGSWFFRKKLRNRDYLNSGVLLLNMKEIKKTGLFQKCRDMCRDTEMFMPDQSAINKLAVSKRIAPRRFNEQRRLKDNTVFQHFTTSFRFFPWVHTLTVKPWDVDRMHEVLNLHEYDTVLNQYEEIRTQFQPTL